MIHVRLAGGLGNQLFQLACALYCRLDGEAIVLATDALGAYKSARQPDVQKIVDLDALGVACRPTNSHWLAARMSLRLPRALGIGGVGDSNFRPPVRPTGNKRRQLVLDGYFQAQWTWETLAVVLPTMARSLRVPAAAASGAPYCAIHVRGTDFLDKPEYALIGNDYYARAFDTLRAQAAVGAVRVVTDDRAHALAMLAPLRSAHPDISFDIPQERGSILDDFASLRNATSRIVPNSTFSWWAAALDPRQAGTIGPGRFLRNAAPYVPLPWVQSIPPATS